MKKVLFSLGAALFCTAQAMAYDFMEGGLAYNKLTDTTVEVTFKGADYNSGKDYTDAAYVIPSAVANGGVTYTVTRIGDSAFYGSAVQSITLPESVTEIVNYAFGNCRYLKELTLPSGITEFPNYALPLSNSSALEKLTINCDPAKVSGKIFTEAGSLPKLKELVFGPYLQEVSAAAVSYWANGTGTLTIAAGEGTLKCDPAAFERWTMTTLNIDRPVELTVPDNVKNIAEIHIGDIEPFTTVAMNSANYTTAKLYVPGARVAAYKATEPWSNFATILPEPGTEVADQTYGFNYTLNEADNTAEIIAAGNVVDPYTGDIEIPATIVVGGQSYTVTSIGMYAFQNCDITSVKLPATIKELKNGAFFQCTDLAEVELNQGLEKLNYDVFAGTKSLKTIVIPGTVKNLPGGNSFANSGIATVVLEEGVETISDDFNGCTALNRVMLPSTLKEIGMYAFEGCTSLKYIDIPSSVRKIGSFAFSGTGITELELPEGLQTLEAQSLGHMNGANNADYTLKSVTLPASLTELDYMTFNNACGLTELTVNGNGTPVTVTGNVPANLLNTPTSVSGVAPLETLYLNRTFVNGSSTDITSTIFDRKTTLKNVTFGPDMTTVPALPSCTAIESITVSGNAVPAVSGTGYSAETYANAVLNVPHGMSAAFRAHEVWGKFAHIEEAAGISAIDAAKVRHTVGTGANKYIFALAFNNANRLDNLVWGVASDNAALTAGEAIAIIADADPRLQLTTDGEGNVTAAAFDLDGNGVFDIKDTAAEGDWNTGERMLASDGTTKVLSICHAATTAADAPYYFYLPAPDAQGVWVPEAMTVKLSDEGFILPVLVQPQGNAVTQTTNWQASSSNTSYRLDRNIVVTPYTFQDESYHARPTFTGKTGTTYMRYRPRVGSSYIESNFMTLTVEAPEVPVTAIILAESEINAGRNKAVDVDYTFEPANATYTAVAMTVEDTSVASYSATTGLKTNKIDGTTSVTVTSKYDADVKAAFTLNVSLQKPVTGVHFGHGTESGIINVYVKQLIGLKPVIEPADADIPDVTITLSDNGTSKADMTCSTYRVNWWDINNVRSQFYELSGHRPTGDHPAKLHVESADGHFVKDFVVNVLESDRTPIDYTDGTIILNEEWFGHTNGGLNYVTPENEIIYQAYERENPGMSFGCTSQYGAIWADKLFVVSKQAQDGGDVLPGGGRLVIADASTLKRISSLDNLTFDGKSGDGRGVAGATPDKIYVSSSNGIYIVDITDVENPVITGRIGSDDSQDLYNGQTGDIINAGRYVFAVQQAGGILCIDPETDEVAKAITDTNAQGVTQTADGTVWYVTIADGHSVFVGLDPETIEETHRIDMPAEIGTVACGWGAWRSTAFKGDWETGDLWFVTGAAGIMGGATGDYYRFNPENDNPADIKPFFTLNGVTGINDFGEEVEQMTYGTPCFDPRNNRLVVMTGRKGAASGGYRDHWLHFVDGDSHEITTTLKLNAYYWFQSLPIFPDKHDAALADDFGEVKLAMSRPEGKTIDLREFVSDADNHDANIRFSLPAANALADEAETPGSAAATLDGSKLTLMPTATGKTNVLVEAQSNGRVATLSIPVNVRLTSGIDDGAEDAANIRIADNRAYIYGYAGTDFAVYSAAGVLLTRFTADTDAYVAQFGFEPGVYVLSAKGVSVKFIVR